MKISLLQLVQIKKNVFWLTAPHVKSSHSLKRNKEIIALSVDAQSAKTVSRNPGYIRMLLLTRMVKEDVVTFANSVTVDSLSEICC